MFKKGCVPWNKGKRLSFRHRKALSIAHVGKPSSMKGRKFSMESIRKLSASHCKYYETHEGYWKGKKRNRETCIKISRTRKRRIKSGKITLFGSRKFYRCGYRKDLGHNCRSEWEANYARYLKYKGIKYQYEPERFHLKGLNTTYCPDFLLEDGTYVEIKGWDKHTDRLKRDAFRKQYGYKLTVIGPRRYKRLIQERK